MIINKEQITTRDQNGDLCKILLISYINKEGKISFLKWQIPKSEMFEWAYTNKANADAPVKVLNNETNTVEWKQWKSYDNRFIKKMYTDKDLSDYRINEILASFGSQVDELFKAYSPEMWFCDIETEVDDEGFPDAEQAILPINTIAITKFPETIVFGRKPLSDAEIKKIQKNLDTYSDIIKGYKFKYLYFPTEKEMLEAFVEFLKAVPAVSGWNFLKFDWQYIFHRCKNLNIDVDSVSPTHNYTQLKLNRKVTINVQVPMHKIIADHMMIFIQWDRTIMPKSVTSLDFVSGTVLGVQKVEHPSFREFYDNHYADYVFYNAIDTILVELIDKKMKTSQIWYMLASELKIELNSAYSTIKPTETVMQNFIYDQHKVIPRKFSSKEVPDSKYEGAFVWPTQAGIYKYVGGLDFASLYPTTMRQFGISPETFMFKDITYKPNKNEIKTKSGAVYRKDPTAIIPAILTHYFALRKQAKKDRKEADQGKEDLIKIYMKRTGKQWEHKG